MNARHQTPRGVFAKRPELAHGVGQPIARQLGLTMLGTLNERIGDRLTSENAGADRVAYPTYRRNRGVVPVPTRASADAW